MFLQEVKSFKYSYGLWPLYNNNDDNNNIKEDNSVAFKVGIVQLCLCLEKIEMQ